MTDRALEFLSGFDGAAYPARLEAEYDLLECFSHTERCETLLARRRSDGALCVAKLGEEGAFAAETLRRIDCPGVPEVYDAYEDGGKSVFVRAFVPGVSARAALKNGPFSRKRTLEIGVQLCDILACLHAQDPPIIHRDVKPGNIILDGERAWLIDFGIARAYDGDAETDTACLGTRAYAPPEQYGYAQTDPRTDVYALGATLYTLCTGRTDAVNAKKTVHNAVLARIIARCTAFSPEKRYQSVKRVRRALLRARHPLRGALNALAAAALLIAALLLGARAAGTRLFDFVPGSAHFSDPLVRAAVCVSLGKEPDAYLSETDLLNVDELYLFADEAVADKAAFEEARERWCETERETGALTTLSDLDMMPNLTALWLGAEPEIDLSPLLDKQRLATLILQYMTLPDVSVIASLPALAEFDVSGSVCADLSPIHECHGLTRLSLHAVACDDYSFLQGLDDFSYVGLEGVPSEPFLQYFRGKCTNHLNISYAPMTRMDWLATVGKLTVLELQNTDLTDISGIEGLLHLMRVDLSGNPELTDLSPLLRIQTLEKLTLSRDMEKAADATLHGAAFTIVYTD